MASFGLDISDVFAGAIAPLGEATGRIIEAASPDAQRTAREKARYGAKAAIADAAKARAMADQAVAEAQRTLGDRRMSGEEAVRRERERDKGRERMFFAGLATVAILGIAGIAASVRGAS